MHVKTSTMQPVCRRLLLDVWMIHRIVLRQSVARVSNGRRPHRIYHTLIEVDGMLTWPFMYMSTQASQIQIQGQNCNDGRSTTIQHKDASATARRCGSKTRRAQDRPQTPHTCGLTHCRGPFESSATYGKLGHVPARDQAVFRCQERDQSCWPKVTAEIKHEPATAAGSPGHPQSCPGTVRRATAKYGRPFCEHWLPTLFSCLCISRSTFSFARSVSRYARKPSPH